MPVIKQIRPLQIFSIPVFSTFYAMTAISLVISFTLFGAYTSNLNDSKQITKGGDTIYKETKKTLLYLSLVFAIVASGPILFCVYKYHSIFGFTQTFPLVSCEIMIVLLFILMILNIFYLVRQLNYCPKDQVYNSDLDMCVENCTVGSYLTPTGKCTPGCLDESDCPNGYPCVDKGCCILEKQGVVINKVVNNECCPIEDVTTDDKGNEICCPLSCGTQCCSSKDEFKCVDNQCVLKCGNVTCKDGEICMRYPATYHSSTTSPIRDNDENDYAYACIPATDECQQQQVQSYPNAIGNFYPAYNGDVAETGQIKTILTTKPNDSAFLDAIKNYSDISGEGQLCGINNAYHFESKEFKNCESIQKCVDSIYYPYTNEIGVVDNGQGGFYCQQWLDFNKTIPAPTASSTNQDKDPLSYYSLLQKKDKPSKSPQNSQALSYVYVSQTDKDFNNQFQKDTTKLSSSTYNACTDKIQYQRSCDDLGTCPNTQQCPFDTAGTGLACDYINNHGYIYTQPVQTSRCIVQNKEFVCSTDPNVKGSVCTDDNKCQDVIDRMNNASIATVIHNSSCAQPPNYDAGGKDVYKYGTPKDCCANQWESRTDGTAGKCKFNEIARNYLAPKVCADGTKPYFYPGSEKIKEDDLCANTHDGFFKEIHYRCCNEDTFKIDDVGDIATNPHCYKDEYTLRFGPSDGAEVWPDYPTKVLTGRGGSSNDCWNPGKNGCDVATNSCDGRLNTITKEVNGQIWSTNK